MAADPWFREIRAVLNAVDDARQAITDAPEGAQHALRTLDGILSSIRESADAAFARYSSGPAQRMIAGMPLSREEYYLCRAMGADFHTAKELGFSDFDDHELHELLCYEDDEWRGYVNVTEQPGKQLGQTPAVRVSLSLGRPPEECLRACLSDRQTAFFESCLPEVLARFG